MLDRIFSIIAPHRCYNCQQIGSVLCTYCIYDIECEGFSNCLLCTHPTFVHNLCKSCRRSTRIEAAWAIGWREEPLKRLVDDYKYEAVQQAVVPLIELLDSRLPLLLGVTICEVPTASAHVRQLGYDHAELLARQLAQRRDLPYQPLLGRTNQQTQHFSGKKARQAQAKHMFAVHQSVSGPVLLVDDIVTTGSSLKAAAETLKRAGASEVYAAVLVRQKPH